MQFLALLFLASIARISARDKIQCLVKYLQLINIEFAIFTGNAEFNLSIYALNFFCQFNCLPAFMSVKLSLENLLYHFFAGAGLWLDCVAGCV